MRAARSLQPLPVIWESRCCNAECPESRRHKTQATASLPIWNDWADNYSLGPNRGSPDPGGAELCAASTEQTQP